LQFENTRGIYGQCKNVSIAMRKNMSEMPTAAPTRLLERIKIVNQLPESIGPFEFMHIQSPAVAALYHSEYQHRRRCAIAAAKQDAKPWGKDICRYLFKKDNQGESDPGTKLMSLFYFRAILEALASQQDGQFTLLPVSGHFAIENGRSHFSFDPVLTDLEGLEVKRIKRCPVCSKFFWTKRSHKRGCTVECARAITNRHNYQNRKARAQRQQFYRRYHSGITRLEAISKDDERLKRNPI
jgi:hypothetical protein